MFCENSNLELSNFKKKVHILITFVAILIRFALILEMCSFSTVTVSELETFIKLSCY